MNGFASQDERLALITKLVRHSPASFGRTALMKCLYFLKVLGGVPVGYSFRLYTYGPFDSDVLDDLRYAESLGAIESTLRTYPGGYGYDLRSSSKAEKIEQKASGFLSKYDDEINWVLGEFGRRSAVDLEMASTVVYVARACASKGNTLRIQDLVDMVQEVKPHLDREIIHQEAARLKNSGYIEVAA